MRLKIAFVFSLSLLTACLSINTGSGDDAGAAAAATPTTDASASTSTPDAAMGVDCIVEQTTGAMLCTTNTLCPGVAVDHDQFPNCGFRVQGGTLDIECACNGSLCPLGVPATCTQAAQMLMMQTEAVVCSQISDGRCTDGTPPTTPTTPSTCDKTCQGECGGDPNCLIGCGC